MRAVPRRGENFAAGGLGCRLRTSRAAGHLAGAARASRHCGDLLRRRCGCSARRRRSMAIVCSPRWVAAMSRMAPGLGRRSWIWDTMCPKSLHPDLIGWVLRIKSRLLFGIMPTLGGVSWISPRRLSHSSTFKPLRSDEY